MSTSQETATKMFIPVISNWGSYLPNQETKLSLNLEILLLLKLHILKCFIYGEKRNLSKFVKYYFQEMSYFSLLYRDSIIIKSVCQSTFLLILLSIPKLVQMLMSTLSYTTLSSEKFW